jgi:hypothetical protein
MNITRKTFYGIGILSAALNILGGAMLLFSIRADLVFNIATVAAGVMMLMLATNLKEDPRGRNFCLAAALLTVLGMVPGIVGIVCAAASWPVLHGRISRLPVPENGLHKAAFLGDGVRAGAACGQFSARAADAGRVHHHCGGGGAGPSGFFAVSGGVTAPCGPGQTYSGGPRAYDDACPAFWERAQRYGEREPRA